MDSSNISINISTSIKRTNTFVFLMLFSLGIISLNISTRKTNTFVLIVQQLSDERLVVTDGELGQSIGMFSLVFLIASSIVAT